MKGTIYRAGAALRNKFEAMSSRAKAASVGLAVAVMAPGASAQVDPAPVIDPIAPVIDTDALVSEVSDFGGTILLAWAGLFIAFGLTYTLVRRLRGTA